jgi:hypothetical protein
VVSTYGAHPNVYGLRGEEYIIWWKKVRQSFDNASTREIFSDMTKDYKTRPLYCLVEFKHNFNWSNEVEDFFNIDLNSILKEMLKDTNSNAGLVLNHLLITITYLSVGCGGEGKFAIWESSFWDLHLHSFVTYWTQTKTFQEDAMPYVVDKEFFSVDIYHCFGVYFILCDGLYRDPNESYKKVQAAQILFPLLSTPIEMIMLQRKKVIS